MGNECSCVKTLKNFEHTSENIRCNDDFFTLFSLFSLENSRHFSLGDQTKLSFHTPSQNFLEHEQSLPPRVLIEVRKGVNFPPSTSGGSFCVRVVFHPSNLSYFSFPATFPHPRWYFLAMRIYQPEDTEIDHTAVVEVLTKTGALGRTVIDLEAFRNAYCIEWMPMRMLRENSSASLEIRLWSVADSKTFWDTKGMAFQTAIETIRNTSVVS